MSCSDPNCSFFNGEKCCDLTSTVPGSPPSMMIPLLVFQDPTEENPEDVDYMPWDAPDDPKKKEEEIPFQPWGVENKVKCPRGLSDREFYTLYCERV